MADDRPVEDPADQLGRLQRELDDFRSTVNARLTRRATGDIESSLRSTPKDGTLIMNGQLVSRVTYPDLWQWAQEQSLVIAGLFTTGDGSTTFGLPDLRGRTIVGVGTLGADTYALGALVGAAHPVLTTAQMPAHGHSVSINSVGDHDHPGSGALADGSHGGHNSGSFGVAAGGDGATAGNGNTSGGNHNHTLSLAGDGGHTHTVTQSSVGSGTALDVRSPMLAVNWLVWT